LNVTAMAMLRRYTASMSNEDAAVLAGGLGIPLPHHRNRADLQSYLLALEPIFRGRKPDVTERLQARIRGTLADGLLETRRGAAALTGNKSEAGHGVLHPYGDMAGAWPRSAT